MNNVASWWIEVNAGIAGSSNGEIAVNLMQYITYPAVLSSKSGR